jgi:hypothetical protein
MKIHLRALFWRPLSRVVGQRLFDWAENNGVADGRWSGERCFARGALRAHCDHFSYADDVAIAPEVGG